MAQTIPTIEPLEITAGDTIAWTKSLSDFPASDSWVLNYRIINTSNKYDIVCTASGADHAANVTATNSANYAAGTYSWQSFVTKGTERYTVGNGNIVIKENLAAKSAGFDIRTSAKKCLDALNTALEVYGKKAYTQEYEIAGRRMKFSSPGEFLSFRAKVQQEVNREIQAERIKNGLSARTKSLIGL